MREQTAATIHVGVYSSAVDSESPPPPSIPAPLSTASLRRRTLGSLVQRLLPCRYTARRAPGCSGVVRLETWQPAVRFGLVWFGFALLGARRGALSCRLQLAQRTLVRNNAHHFTIALIRPGWRAESIAHGGVRPLARPPAPAARRRAYVSATRGTERNGMEAQLLDASSTGPVPTH